MIIEDPSDYDVEVGEPYLHKDMNDKYVILQDETLTRHEDSGQGQILMYSSEILIDPDPSDAKIFKMKLKGAIRGSWPF